ncbi:MAG: DUF5777 family beta-barrel protein [Bacteroidota bacterium]
MKKNLLILGLVFATSALFAQDEEIKIAEGTFMSTRIANSHSVEMTKPGRLEFKMCHRMGRLNDGPYQLFGFDQSTFRMGFDYGINDWLNAGFGRSTVQKLYDGFFKVRMLRQSSGKKNFPVSMVWMSSMAINSMKWEDPTRTNYFSSRMSYVHQLIVARKITDNFSFQLMPTVVHRNLVATSSDKNDVICIGAAARYKLNRTFALTAEYTYILPDQISSQYNGNTIQNSFSAGIDIFTGKHVFQVFLTNSTGMAEKQAFTESTESWNHGGIHIGFNIERYFTLVNK